MARKITYWACTILVAAMGITAAVTYLIGGEKMVQAFTHVGYPQQLRVMLGIAKGLGGLTLLAPGLSKLKEWAYAGFTFAWIAAIVAHYLAGDGFAGPIVLLALLAGSYLTRPAGR